MQREYPKNELRAGDQSSFWRIRALSVRLTSLKSLFEADFRAPTSSSSDDVSEESEEAGEAGRRRGDLIQESILRYVFFFFNNGAICQVLRTSLPDLA